MQKILRRLIGEDIKITIIPCNESWNIVADQSQMEQVIMNLVVNARDAIPAFAGMTSEINVVICKTLY